MSIWLAADIALLCGIAACGVLIVRARRIEDCFVALQMAGMLAVLALMLLAQAMSRPSFCDLALALAVLSFPGGLVFAHFLELWFE